MIPNAVLHVSCMAVVEKSEFNIKAILQKLNEIANSDKFQRFADNAVNVLATVSVAALNILNMVASVGNFIAENWSNISPVIYAATTP